MNEHTPIARTSSCGLMMTFHISIHVPPNANPLAMGRLVSNMNLQWSAVIQTEHVTSQKVVFCASLYCKVGELFADLHSLKVSAIKKKKMLQKSRDHSFIVFHNKI